jgi:hypothetical protein
MKEKVQITSTAEFGEFIFEEFIFEEFIFENPNGIAGINTVIYFFFL